MTKPGPDSTKDEGIVAFPGTTNASPMTFTAATTSLCTKVTKVSYSLMWGTFLAPGFALWVCLMHELGT